VASKTSFFPNLFMINFKKLCIKFEENSKNIGATNSKKQNPHVMVWGGVGKSIFYFLDQWFLGRNFIMWNKKKKYFFIHVKMKKIV
jgi:hypothetical protein